MSVSKVRCQGCHAFVPREEIYRDNGVGRVCSEECLKLLFQARRVKKSLDTAERKKQKKVAPRHLDYPTRQEVRQRDGERCRWCGRNGSSGLQVHHIRYRSQGGSDHPSNLILLCQQHHEEAHSNKKRWQKVLLAANWMLYVEGERLPIPVVEKRLIRLGLLS
jgi:hypothetical protein